MAGNVRGGSGREDVRMRLQDKVALVTGGASGFGRGICELYAREGAKVAVVDVNEQGAKEVALALGNNAIGLGCDVRRAADVKAAVDATLQAFGAPEIIVNNAGVSHKNQP